MFEKTNNSRQKGDVGLGCAIAYFAQQNWTVSIPLTDSQSYDLIIDDKNGLKKVQVKTTEQQEPNGVFKVDLRTCGGNQSFKTVKKFDHSTSDLLFVLTDKKS